MTLISSPRQVSLYHARENVRGRRNPASQLFLTREFAQGTDLTDAVFDYNQPITFECIVEVTAVPNSGVVFEFGTSTNGVKLMINRERLICVAGPSAGDDGAGFHYFPPQLQVGRGRMHLVVAIDPGNGRMRVWQDGNLAIRGGPASGSFAQGWAETGDGSYGDAETGTSNSRSPADVTTAPSGFKVVGPLRVYKNQLPRQMLQSLAAMHMLPGPENVVGLLGWWDASAEDTIEQTASAFFWNNRSIAAGNPFSVGLSTPDTGTRQLNGLNVIDFDGSTLLQSTPSLPAELDISSLTSMTVAIVDSTNNAADPLLGIASSDITAHVDAQVSGEFQFGLTSSGLGLTSPLLPAAPTDFSGSVHVFVTRFDADAGEVKMWVDGGSPYVTGADYNGALAPGFRGYIFTTSTFSNQTDGAIGELLLYQGALDVNQMNLLGEYLQRWGTTWSPISL